MIMGPTGAPPKRVIPGSVRDLWYSPMVKWYPLRHPYGKIIPPHGSYISKVGERAKVMCEVLPRLEVIWQPESVGKKGFIASTGPWVVAVVLLQSQTSVSNCCGAEIQAQRV